MLKPMSLDLYFYEAGNELLDDYYLLFKYQERAELTKTEYNFGQIMWLDENTR